MNWDKYTTHIIIAIGMFTISLLTVVGYKEISRSNKLMEECKADGKKEYECEALLQGRRHQHVPMVLPIVVPVR